MGKSRWNQVWGLPSERIWSKRKQIKDIVVYQVTKNVFNEIDIVFSDLLWTSLREQTRDQIWDQVEEQMKIL